MYRYFRRIPYSHVMPPAQHINDKLVVVYVGKVFPVNMKISFVESGEYQKYQSNK